jgi:hypothetical protein
MPTPRQEQSDAILVPGQRGDVEPGRFGGPQRRRETDEQQGPVVQLGQGVGVARKAARNDSTTSAVFSERPAVGAADPGKGRRHRGRGGRRRVAGEEMQIAQRRVAQP